MAYLQYVLMFAVVAIIRPGSGSHFENHGKTATKGECPAKPKGISSFRAAAGTRLYYAWSTVQGTARTAFLSDTLCRGGRIQDCSCIGYDVTGYNRTSAEIQEGFTFSVNKKLRVSDLFHFTRPWTYSGDYHLKCHYDTDIQYGNTSQSSHVYDSYKGGYSTQPSSPSSYYTVWNKNATSIKKIDIFSKSYKVLSWTSTEVVLYDCTSIDPHIRIYTTYIPSKNSEIPFSVFDILTQLGININNLSWIKLDHNNCVYPNTSSYQKLLAALNPTYKNYY